MITIQCIICHSTVSVRQNTQSTCSSPDCKRLHKQMLARQSGEKDACRSKSGLCVVCRSPLPAHAGPNQRVCSPKCKRIAEQYDIDLHVYVMPDDEYIALEIEPPQPGFVECIGHGYPKHTFWSEDKRKIRICQACKKAAESGALIHVGGSVAWISEEFSYLDGIMMGFAKQKEKTCTI